ncbi:uncharacterized protein LOC135928578 [Gordionus sp. m RMFG-2023]|uniref:uncharacterized protein LOC135928578 n=1 Tax=Gordionus sp. m RMFG-2023 TaxID=3053472 RepID=UPI0031FE39BF
MSNFKSNFNKIFNSNFNKVDVTKNVITANKENKRRSLKNRENDIKNTNTENLIPKVLVKSPDISEDIKNSLHLILLELKNLNGKKNVEEKYEKILDTGEVFNFHQNIDISEDINKKLNSIVIEFKKQISEVLIEKPVEISKNNKTNNTLRLSIKESLILREIREMRENMKNLSREVSNLKIKSNNVIESCELCGRKGHIGKNCYLRDRKTNENVTAKPSEKNDIVCHRCGFVGHIKRNCMVKDANFKSGFPQQNPQIINVYEIKTYDTDHDRMCFKCEEMGHIAIHCIQSVSGSQ